MTEITQADRDAARALREALADISGFWHRFDDDSPLCRALAEHRRSAERSQAEASPAFFVAARSTPAGPALARASAGDMIVPASVHAFKPVLVESARARR